ncbi:hypothetical protein ASG52_22725 [Methylobacterium sp. Leaf456]|uniref:hypothetical protein n=1 Tax=Methylobacterium sp. Leaf456 TaxID=1736382 RepID=UPI0006F41C39|nr:hypothetical protein [Methylobacterium sp. Leaf456]KQT58034.1 hypothetical protein ASG52_22725 [Methylobacterium sp. Leaf456]
MALAASLPASSAGFVPDRPDLGHRAEGWDLADPAFFEGSLDPSAPRLLPPAAYRALAFAELEDDVVWTRAWLAIGLAAEIPSPGDLLPFTAGHHGIHVQRDEAGGFVGRFNKAQHGGCRAVPLQCRTGTRTRCSFTACGYSRDGTVLPADGGSTPAMHQYLGLRPERLLPVAVRPWGSLIRINLDPEAEPLETAQQGLAALVGETRRAEFSANWKLAAQALAEGMPRAEGQHSLDLTGRLTTGAAADISLHFPNLILIASGPETCAIMLQPTALGQTLLRIGLLGPEGAAPSDLEASWSTWQAEIAARLASAVAVQAALGNFATPPAASSAGLWLQQRIAERVGARAVPTQTQPLYVTAQGRGC